MMCAGDLATIYSLTALFNAGLSGQGEVIATVEDTNLYANSDWTTFRTSSSSPRNSMGNLTVVHPRRRAARPAAIRRQR